MMSSMAGQFGMPFGRKASERPQERRARRARRAVRGPTPPKVRNPLGARHARRVPRPVAACRQGLDELPPGLADFDLSKLKFPGQK